MNRLTSILTGALAVQLLLSAALFWPREQTGESDARTALLALETGGIDRLVISDAEDSLLLKRSGDNWIMPDYHGLPAQDSRLNRVLEDLPRLPRGWPVAGSENAAGRFEVAGDSFQRRVEYFAGDATAGEIYVGTSPGFRKVHVRPAGDDTVYAVEFNSFELPTTPNEWLDKSLLQVTDVSALQGLDYSLALEGDNWQSGAGGTPAAAEVDKLVNGLGSLRVTGAADIATAAVLDEVDAPPTLVVEAAGKRYEYRLYEIEEAYYVRRSDIPVYFGLSAFDYDRLNEVNGESLFSALEDSGEDIEEGSDGSLDDGAGGAGP